MSIPLLQLMTATGGKPKPKIDDVFLVDQYKGTGAARTLTDGIDRTDGVPVLDIFKAANSTQGAVYYDTLRGAGKQLTSISGAAETTQAQGVTTYFNDGLSIGTLAAVNASTAAIMKYSFKESPGFFCARLVAHVSGTADTVDLSSLGIVGMVVVKRRDAVTNFFMWHRANTPGKLCYLNTVAAEVSDTSISVSGTSLTLAASLATGSYVIYGWAHDPSADGLIRCDSVTATAGVPATADIGGEAQFVLAYTPTVSGSRRVFDDLRSFCGLIPGGSTSEFLALENSNAEALSTLCGKDNARLGFSAYLTGTLAYMAIPRPRKKPTSGTEVFAPIAQNGGGVVDCGFMPDGALIGSRTSSTTMFFSGWRSPKVYKYIGQASANNSAAMGRRTPTGMFDANGGTAVAFMYWMLRRAPGFYAQENYFGTSSARANPHSLGVPPELIMVGPGDTTGWDESGASAQAFAVRAVPATSFNETLRTDSVAAKAANYDTWGGGAIGSATTFNLGGGDISTNAAGVEYVAHLFATLPGVSKVGAYTGNGTTQEINCGFAAGARGVIIRDTAGGSWYMWDTARGIVAGNDPYSRFSGAEVTTDDSLDPAAIGFAVNQTTATNINVAGHTYLFLAIA